MRVYLFVGGLLGGQYRLADGRPRITVLSRVGVNFMRNDNQDPLSVFEYELTRCLTAGRSCIPQTHYRLKGLPQWTSSPFDMIKPVKRMPVEFSNPTVELPDGTVIPFSTHLMPYIDNEISLPGAGAFFDESEDDDDA